MQLLCPACQTPLAAPAGQVAVACGACALEVDLSRLGTVAGKPRFLPERDRTGAQVDGYRIEARLGSGGMGHVYRAVRDTPAGPEPAAVKFLAAGLAGDPELHRRFLREVQLLRGLAHPAIVRVLASGELDGVPWFAMTLVAGPSLRARLADGPLAPDEARAVFGRVLAALEHAHAQGVIHRDLKPGNVLLGPEGAVLADFGIAHPGETVAAPLTRLTETAAVLGTLPYMSPEQRAGTPLDRRSDLFSVGVMLYEALTGVVPQGAFAAPSKLRPGLPVGVDRVVMRLLQPRPADRHPTAADAARALDRALAPTRRRRLALSVGASAAVALASLGSWLGLHQAPAPAKLMPAATISAKADPTALTPPLAPQIQSPAIPTQAAPPQPIETKQRLPSPKAGKLPFDKNAVPFDKSDAALDKRAVAATKGRSRASKKPVLPVKSGFSPNSRAKR